VINGRIDETHLRQALADAMTIREHSVASTGCGSHGSATGQRVRPVDGDVRQAVWSSSGDPAAASDEAAAEAARACMAATVLEDHEAAATERALHDV
jgi:hypothetical protein